MAQSSCPARDTPMIEVAQWLETAAPGDRKIYHTGNLAFDRSCDPGLDIVARKFLEAAGYRPAQLNGIFHWVLSKEPRCYLVQSRVPGFQHVKPRYIYIAIKR